MNRTKFLFLSIQNFKSIPFLLLWCLFLPLLFINIKGISQNNWPCGIHDSLHNQGYDMMYYGADNSSNTWLEKYRTPGHWIPTENTPIKTILVNWIVCQKDDGTGGWVDSPEFRAGVDSMFTYLNEWYSNSVPKEYSLTCEPTIDYITDTKIRFELNEIIFIRNTTLHRTLDGDLVIQYLEQNHPDYKKAMSHIFTMPDPQPPYWGYYAVNQTYNQSYVLTAHSMYWPFVVYHDHIHHIAHEYGHALGLHHTYDGEYRQISHYDFLDDIFGLCAEPSCTCNPPQGYVCYLTHNCFWQFQPGPYPLMAGMPNPRYISPKYAGRMHRALSLYKNIFKVNNMPMHKYVKERGSYIHPLYITEDETWDFAIKLYQDLYVESGATLTITKEVKMPVAGRIIVKPGAKLIIDGAIITSAHDYPWQGIEVWGNSTAHQWPDSNGNYQQGRVILNDATIENAICALNLWKPGDYTKTGGIVFADEKTKFINNIRSVHALNYRNFHPNDSTKTMDYQAVFNDCSFTLDGDYHNIYTFYKHVDLSIVNGVRFNGCDFSLSPDALAISDYNQAIAAYSAGFKVNAFCNTPQTPCPESEYDKCTFTGFRTAIYAGNGSLNTNTFYVNRAVFSNNSIGVEVSNVWNPIIINSDFYLSKNQFSTEQCSYGIYLEKSTGFAIEENKFFKADGAPLADYFGIGSINCETVSEIYKNEFTGLSAGNYAYGKNFEDISAVKGLTYLCNKNTGNWADFYITGNILDDDIGIQFWQGSPTQSAGNTFSRDGANWHIYNERVNPINYHYCITCPNETPEKIGYVSLIPVNTANSCTSHYGGHNGRDVVMNTQQKLESEVDFALASLNYDNVEILFNQFKDGGSTIEKEIEINTSTSGDMWSLRAELLGDSPHLSKEVLKLVADKTDVFTESVIFDILAANPDELRGEELLKYVAEKEIPLPEYMIDILRQIATGTTYKTVLLQEMARYSHDRNRSANDIIRSILNEDELDVIQLRNWLSNLGGIESDKQIIATYLQEGNFSAAFSLANTFPQMYNLQQNDITEHNRYISLLQLEQTLFNEGRKVDQLTQSELNMLNEYALASEGSAGAQARGILESFYGADFNDCKSLDGEESYKNTIANPNLLGEAYGLSISVKPNPASDWAAIDYTLPHQESVAVLEIADANGKRIETINLSGNHGQKLWDTRVVPSGSYIITIKVAGFLKSVKLIVSK